jgi:hypothetical protein
MTIKSLGVSVGSIGGIPESEKGQPNGVAELGPDGKIPVDEMPFEVWSYQGDWDVATNDPSLTDGVGTTGWAYVVSTGGTRDTGHGNIVWNVGDVALYDGTVWDQIPLGGQFFLTIGGNSAVAPLTYGTTTAQPVQLMTNNVARLTVTETGNVGIGTITPNAPLEFAAVVANRKVVMFDGSNNDNQYFGFGVNSNVLRYQVSATNAAHVFYAGASASASNEVFRIYGTGGYLAPSQSYVITGTDGSKLWLAKYSSGTGHNNAPTAIGASATYLYIGGREYGNNGFGGIGFSYVGDTSQNPAVWIGWQEMNTAGNTSGDFIVATRPTTTNVAPTERLRITAAGGTEMTGVITKYNGLATAAMGVPPILASYNTLGQSANIGATTIYAVPADGAGMYRVFAYAVVTQAATTSSTLPNLGILWTDSDTSVALSSSNVTPTNAANALGAFGNGDIVINAKGGTTIQFQTSNYASAGATSMQYVVRLRLEFLG